MLVIPARAKLNLGLAVVGRRSSGFHEIASIVVHLDWHDLVGVTTTEAPGVTVSVTGAAAAEIPTDAAGNLAGRAATVAVAGRGGASVWIDKRIPALAGLGGGSADAAATLRALGVADSALAASLGADVPATLRGGALRVRGIGEQLSPLRLPALHVAVAIAGTSSTAATFAALTPADHRGTQRIDALEQALITRSEAAAATTGAIDDLCGSDLEAAAIRANPALGDGLRRRRTAVASTRWHLTGSGGAAFALAASPAEAGALAAAAEACGFAAQACRTVAAIPSP